MTPPESGGDLAGSKSTTYPEKISKDVTGPQRTEDGSESSSPPGMRPQPETNSEPESTLCDGNTKETILVSFTEGDPENPYNWSTSKKCFILFVGTMTVFNSTFGSSLPSGAIEFIRDDFHVTNEEQLVLPISLFLIGYVLGPIFFGPLSETYGRRVIMLWSFVVFALFTMACALAPNWPSLLVFRLLCGINASSPIAIVGGLYADIFGDPVTRGRALAVFIATTVVGPEIAPSISGFVAPVSWRWAFWVGLIIAGASLVLLAFLPETFGPVLLKRKAQRMRKENSHLNTQVYAPIELEKKDIKHIITVVLMRPLHMMFKESIVLFTCLYLSVAYAIFYLFFEAYPIIFQGTYGMNAGVSGLAFLPVLIGAAIALVCFLSWDHHLQRAKKQHKPWSQIEEYRRLPLSLLGGPMYVISLFWLGWTSRVDVHWIVPMLAGIPFGLGFMLIFMPLMNYIGDAYLIYAASAMSATSMSRSVFGAVLPLAAKRMYQTLGISWASSLLAFLSLAMSIIPFAFIRYGERIRASSRFCQELKAKMEEAEKQKMESKRSEEC